MDKQPPDLDPELRRLFIEEAEQKASEISRGIALCQDSKADDADSLDRYVWLQMRFAEYSGIANTLGLQRSGQACALAVDEITQVIGGARDAEDSLPALFDDALEAIDNAVEYLHGEDIDPSLIFDSDADEPTVAEQLPELAFPELQSAQPQTVNKPDTSSANPPILEQSFPTDVDSSLLEVFLDEARELLELGEKSWQDWQSGHNSAEAVKELKRVFHTLKGGARLVQMSVLGDYVHQAEDWMEAAEAPNKAHNYQTKIRTALDELATAFAAFNQAQPAYFGKATPTTPQAPAQATPLTEAPAEQPTTTPQRSFVRVNTNTLDSLRQRASEVNALRNQIQQTTTALQTEQQISIQTIASASNALRKARFSLERLIEKLPAEHSAALSDSQLESQMALQAMDEVLLQLSRQCERSQDLGSHLERALSGQSKAGFALQENILSTRLLPFSDYSNRLKRIVRQAAEQQEKQVVLLIEGEQSEVDRQVIEQLLPALDHMLRNAVVHGIENETARRQAGKPTTGTIRLNVRRARGKLELDLRDDGAGLALDKIQQKAIQLGIIAESDILSERRLGRLIFHPGLSASDTVDQLAGRGVGMDVVETTVHDLGGSIDVHSNPGQGTRFSMRLPMGETALTAIIVTIADELYAIPQNDIRNIQRLDDQTLSQGYQEDVPIAWGGRGWSIRSLGHWLGLGPGRLPGPRKSLPALLINADDRYVAVVVDHAGDSAEYNLETLPPAVTGILGVSAAVILEDGQVAPVLDMPALIKANVQYQRQRLHIAAPDSKQRFSVMVVDDSTTWLRQLSRGLGRYPLDITTCKDGQQALYQLDKHQPQLLVVDLEMPRMDGLEFLRRLRRNPKLSNIPAIMFSTVTNNSQRTRARQLGAKAWVTKSANLRALLSEMDRQLGTEFARHEADSDAAP